MPDQRKAQRVIDMIDITKAVFILVGLHGVYLLGKKCQFEIILCKPTSNGVKHLKINIFLMIKNN